MCMREILGCGVFLPFLVGGGRFEASCEPQCCDSSTRSLLCQRGFSLSLCHPSTIPVPGMRRPQVCRSWCSESHRLCRGAEEGLERVMSEGRCRVLRRGSLLCVQLRVVPEIVKLGRNMELFFFLRFRTTMASCMLQVCRKLQCLAFFSWTQSLPSNARGGNQACTT